MNKDVMWLIFVLIIIGIVFSFQRKNLNLFTKSPQTQAPGQFPEHGAAGTSGSPTAPETAPTNQSTNSSFFTLPNITTPPPTIQNPIKSAAQPAPAPPAPATSAPLKNPLRVNTGGAAYGDFSQEYISLDNFDYENKQTAVISGLTLQNRDRASATIGKDEYGNNISLKYGERAIIATGESALGKNFKINKCSGYMAQGKNISPSMSFSCPRISDLALPRNLNNRCIDYIESLNSCVSPTINADTGINNDCAEFVSQHASYAGCVADHKNDSDFNQPEWRIYLGKNAEMWGNRHENIQLFGQLGKLITETSY
ncbi:MAG: hypothetical protein Q8Q46_01305 [Candidatus Giovannonibacteria bacterium]|nr:hypothetical protein [Candidatus Giovannonibacteria bacterium]